MAAKVVAKAKIQGWDEFGEAMEKDLQVTLTVLVLPLQVPLHLAAQLLPTLSSITNQESVLRLGG